MLGIGEWAFNWWGKQPTLIAGLIDVRGFAEQLDQAIGTELANRYLQTFADFQAGAQRIVNTLGDNLFSLGAVFAMFPKARVIYCRRGAMGVCFEVYFRHFDMLPYATDLSGTAAVYRQQQRMLEHWQSLLSPQLLIVDFHDLLEDPSAVYARLVEFLGLDSDSSPRWALPAIDRRRVLDWHPYQPYLEELRESFQL